MREKPALPRLDELFPNFEAIQEVQNKSRVLEVFLRKAIGSLRSKKSEAFYSIREVAKFFKVPMSSVAGVYDKLDKEGLVTTVRGSGTTLEGKRREAKPMARGVVGVPIYLPAFIFGKNNRDFYVSLEGELRKHGYLTTFIFFSKDESMDTLLERLKMHHLDILLWLTPGAKPEIKEVLLSLEDQGVQLVTIGGDPEELPGQKYWLNLDHGFRAAAAGWRKQGLTKVYLIEGPQGFSAHFMRKCQEAFQAEGFKIHQEKVREEQFFRSFDHYPESGKAGIVFLDHAHYEALCNYNWRVMMSIFESKRVLLAQGLVRHAAFADRTILVDTIECNLPAFARKLGRDIGQQRLFNFRTPEMIKMAWRPKVNLGGAMGKVQSRSSGDPCGF